MSLHSSALEYLAAPLASLFIPIWLSVISLALHNRFSFPSRILILMLNSHHQTIDTVTGLSLEYIVPSFLATRQRHDCAWQEVPSVVSEELSVQSSKPKILALNNCLS